MRNTKWLVIGATLGVLFLVVTASVSGQKQTLRSSAESSSKPGKPAARPAAPATPIPAPARVPNEAPVSVPPDYVIGEQDVLMITVWREPELSGVVMVRPDGKITLPLVNEIPVLGMTPTELTMHLTEKLQPFLNVPQVTVTVREINSRKVYVIGQVGREGSHRINSMTTVLQIIAEAGGLRDFANRKRIYVMRNENGKQVRYPFNYDEVIQGRNYAQNILLRPGDTVVVP